MVQAIGKDGLSSRQVVEMRRQAVHGSHGFILGLPGSGKTVAAQQQIRSLLANSGDRVVVIDIDNSYKTFAEELGGQVIAIEHRGPVCINLFDICTAYYDPDLCILRKVDFICSWLEFALGLGSGLSPLQRSLIDICVREAYEPYLSRQALANAHEPGILPTLQDFYRILRGYEEQYGDHAKTLRIGLEMYVMGCCDMFASATNVHSDQQLLVYDLSGLGHSVRGAAMMAVVEHIWTHSVSDLGKRQLEQPVWVYLDEAYYLLREDASLYYFASMLKYAQAVNCIFTGVTMDMSNLLGKFGRTMLANCAFIQLLRLSPFGLGKIAELLGVPFDELLKEGDWDEPGNGILFCG